MKLLRNEKAQDKFWQSDCDEHNENVRKCVTICQNKDCLLVRKQQKFTFPCIFSSVFHMQLLAFGGRVAHVQESFFYC